MGMFHFAASCLQDEGAHMHVSGAKRGSNIIEGQAVVRILLLPSR